MTRSQGLLGGAVRLQEVRDVAAATQLGYLQVDRAVADFQSSVAVAVAAVDPLVATLAIRSTAQRFDVHPHQPLQRKLQRLFDEVGIVRGGHH